MSTETQSRYERFGKAYYEKNKGTLLAAEKDKKRWVEYYEKNKEVIQEKFKVYREENKEKMKEYMKAYRDKHRGELSESHICECGGKYTKNHEDTHKASKRHVKFAATNT